MIHQLIERPGLYVPELSPQDEHEFQQRTLRAGVADVAEYLDEVEPGWADRINPATLDVRFPNTCVSGQLDEPGSKKWIDWAQHFSPDWTVSGESTRWSRALSSGDANPFWLLEIASRREAATQ